MVTVGERPARIIIVAVGSFGAGLVPGLANLAASIATTATLAVCAVGFFQLTATVHATLAAGSGRADEAGDDAGGEHDERQPTAGMG